MSRYVDGYVIPIKKKNIAKYKKMATIGRNVWMDHGALDYYECVGESLIQPHGVSFKKFSKLKNDETVIFAFIVYKSKAHRNKVNKAVMKDKRMQPESFKQPMEMPFDMKRFTMGGFKVLVYGN